MLDYLHQAAILIAMRLESVLDQMPGRAHSRLSRFNKQFGELPQEAFGEYLGIDPDSVSWNRCQRLLECVPEEYRNVAATLIDLTIWSALYPESREILREFSMQITIQTAYFLETGSECPANAGQIIFQALQPYFLPEQSEIWFAQVPFSADRRLMEYLGAAENSKLPFSEWTALFTENETLPELYLYEDICERVSTLLQASDRLIQIRGDDKSGRKFLLKHAAAKCGRRMLFADCAFLYGENHTAYKIAANKLLREALLEDAAVCWYHIDPERITDMRSFAIDCIAALQKRGVQVCCCTGRKLDFSEYIPLSWLYDMPKITQHDRITLWNAFYGKEPYPDIDPTQLAIRYKLSCGQIASVFERRRNDISIGDETEKQRFERICSWIASPSDKLFRIIHPTYQLGDLILPEEDKQKIEVICANFRYYHQVYTDWDMQSKMPYGRAVSVILCGPPGTGKTMTAHVIAATLELPLFHADLSQITDKYIGETEKHLEAIFTEAEKSNCVLFLDEADAICGKRSEVNDSRDRYANNDTAFILQRLEQYDGIVILSTNFVNNLDNAFMRRMKYILNFSLPTAPVRLELWRSCFPAGMPVAEDLDLEYLAEQFEFSGANIKNVILNAAFLAAKDHETIRMQHILLSIEDEYLKFQKHILPGEYGRYSALFLQAKQAHSSHPETPELPDFDRWAERRRYFS